MFKDHIKYTGQTKPFASQLTDSLVLKPVGHRAEPLPVSQDHISSSRPKEIATIRPKRKSTNGSSNIFAGLFKSSITPQTQSPAHSPTESDLDWYSQIYRDWYEKAINDLNTQVRLIRAAEKREMLSSDNQHQFPRDTRIGRQVVEALIPAEEQRFVYKPWKVIRTGSSVSAHPPETVPYMLSYDPVHLSVYAFADNLSIHSV